MSKLYTIKLLPVEKSQPKMVYKNRGEEDESVREVYPNVFKEPVFIIAVIDHEDGYYMGYSRCAPGDVYSRKKGMALAIKRATLAKRHIECAAKIKFPQVVGDLIGDKKFGWVYIPEKKGEKKPNQFKLPEQVNNVVYNCMVNQVWLDYYYHMTEEWLDDEYIESEMIINIDPIPSKKNENVK